VRGREGERGVCVCTGCAAHACSCSSPLRRTLTLHLPMIWQELECLVRAKAELKRENEMLLHQKGFLSQISAQHIVVLEPASGPISTP
jgi:hypothetical protein